MYNAVHCISTSQVGVEAYARVGGCYMARSKTATLTLRIDPGVKEGLRQAAELEHRSMANMIEVMVRKYCANVGLEVPCTTEQLQHKNTEGKKA